MIGPGKYDTEASEVMEATRAAGIVLLIVGGDRGEGFSVQGPLSLLVALPGMLREVADAVEADVSTMRLDDKPGEAS
jgi:hypothetical protein